MGVYELLMKAMEERDERHYIEALHDDFEFVRHQTGTTMSKSKMSEMMASMMANKDVVINNPRCIYEKGYPGRALCDGLPRWDNRGGNGRPHKEGWEDNQDGDRSHPN